MKNILILMIAITVMASCSESGKRKQILANKITNEVTKTPDNMLGAILEDGQLIVISPRQQDAFVTKGQSVILQKTWVIHEIDPDHDRIYYTIYGVDKGIVPQTTVAYDSTLIFEYFKGVIL